VRDKDGIPMHLVFQTSVNDVRQKTQDIVRQSPGSIGVEIEPKVIDASIYFGPPTASTNTTVHFYADLEMYARGNDNPEPDDYMRQWLCAEASQQANGWTGANYARYCDPAYDALYEQSRTELDPDKRRALFIAMNDLLMEDAALVPLVERPTALGLSNSIVLDRGPTPWDPETWDIADWQRK
jgi:peptide/nickel transport system substrate-binding protein